MRRPLTLLALLLSICGPLAAQPVTQSDLLRRLIDLDRLMRPPTKGERTGVRCGTILRADPVGNADDWNELAAFNGPGAITRIFAERPAGILRITVDGTVVLETPFADWMAGKSAPVTPPFCAVEASTDENRPPRSATCYWPIGFSKSIRLWTRDYHGTYQVGYVQFPLTTAVAPFQATLSDDDRETAEAVAEVLAQGLSDEQIDGAAESVILPIAIQQNLANGKVIQDQTSGTGIIRSIFVGLTDRLNPPNPYTLHKCVLRIYFDGESQPAVEAPLTDFFGSAYELHRLRALPLGTSRAMHVPLPDRRYGEDRYMYCFFPMPFRAGFRIEIQNVSGEEIGLLLYLRVSREVPADDALYFHARYRRESPCQRDRYPLLETRGQGRLVALTLGVDRPRRGWWGAGHEQIVSDSDEQQVWRGTNIANLFDGAAPLREHRGVFGGAAAAPAFGKSTGYRIFMSDAPTFFRNVRFDLENRSDKPYATDYGSVAYWYGELDARSFFRPLRMADMNVHPLRIPEAIEIEGRVVGDGWGREIDQDQSRGFALSGERAVMLNTDTPITIEIPSLRARRVRLKLRTNPRRAFVNITVRSADGNQEAEVTFDRNGDGVYDLGEWDLELGANPVIVECGGYPIVDCWIPEPLK